jgi:hypothetical protein
VGDQVVDGAVGAAAAAFGAGAASVAASPDGARP